MADLSDKIEFLDKKTQDFLINKYKVTFYDQLTHSMTEKLIDNPIIKRINKMYNNELLLKEYKPLYNYEPFKKFEEKDGVHFNTINIGKIMIEKDVILSVKKGEYIFKGTRDYITPELEKEFLKKSDPIQPYWFGSDLVGYLYAKTYKGGLSAYKFKNDSKLFIISDIRNEKRLINFLHNLTEKEIEMIGHSKQDILDSLRVKYGYDCNIGYQIKYIERYTKYPDLWMSRFINKKLYLPDIIKYRNKRIFGAGKLDRTCGRFVCYFAKKNGYNGYCSLYNYSNFYANGILGDEVIIYDQKENIERDIDHELDWIQWKKFLDFDIKSNIFKNYVFNPIFHSKKFVGVFNQYYKNQTDNDRNKEILKIIKNKKSYCRFLTFNVHSFVSSNLNDTFEIVINKLKELLIQFDIDFCILEEYASYIDDDYFNLIFNNYNILKTPNLGNKFDKYFGNVILSKDKISIFKFQELSSNKGNKRMAIIFNIENENFKNISFCGTHLEIGERYTERSGTFKQHKQILDIYNSNVNKRILELNKIQNLKPDIIMGDFNFTKDDPEFEHINNLYNDTLKEEYPTLFNNERVDFIFKNKKSTFDCESFVISYPYSDHLPVLGILY